MLVHVYINLEGKGEKMGMKYFDIYNHPVRGYEAVKHGFSWPAFCFGMFWALAKRLWKVVGVTFAAYFTVVFATVILQGYGYLSTASLLLILLLLAYIIMYSSWGNDWRRRDLEKRGFEKLGALEAKTSNEAIEAAQSGSVLLDDTELSSTMPKKRSLAWKAVFTMIIIQNILLLGLIFGKGINSLDTIFIFAGVIAAVSWVLSITLSAPDVVKALEKAVSANVKLLGYMLAIVLIAMTIIGLPVAAVAIYFLLIWYVFESIKVAQSLFRSSADD